MVTVWEEVEAKPRPGVALIQSRPSIFRYQFTFVVMVKLTLPSGMASNWYELFKPLNDTIALLSRASLLHEQSIAEKIGNARRNSIKRFIMRSV
jgi:hypothetical protein